ncbi:MAG: hypothetical protein MI754_19380 [Chromatiales bacterium]|nr:hypothetical protein [Chromatiales bacterium]
MKVRCDSRPGFHLSEGYPSDNAHIDQVRAILTDKQFAQLQQYAAIKPQ